VDAEFAIDRPTIRIQLLSLKSYSALCRNRGAGHFAT
jgi:hypothetical protein